MRYFRSCVFGLAVSFLWTACYEVAPEHISQPGVSSQNIVSASALAARQRLAESGQLIVSGKALFETAFTGDEMAAALDIPANLITSTELLGSEVASAVLPNLGVIKPREGSSLVVLSTGFIGSAPPPEAGTDFAPGGAGGDSVTLRINLALPGNTAKLSFDFNFLSSESPDFVGGGFNDTFTARVTDANGQREVSNSAGEIPLASVNSSLFFDASDTCAGGTHYDIFTKDPAGIDSDFGLGLPDAGITNYQNVEVEVTGDRVTLEFDIRDQGDGILDSAVVIDNVQVSLLETIDPNPDLLTAQGNVSTDIAALASQGKAIAGIAADGATQVLLRARLPGSGQATISLANGASAPADGGLSAVGASDLLSSVTVPVQEVSPGVFYAFALYRAPENFSQGSHDNVADRSLRFNLNYDNNSINSNRDTRIVRPPLVIVPGLWSGCSNWNRAAIRNDFRFSVTCASYIGSHADTLAANAEMVPNAINEALEKLRRDERIAVTQADVLGHSMGGIIARMHANSADYRNALNFNDGDINRLITMNTPHTGSKIADETVRYRATLDPVPPVTDPEHSDHAIVELTNAFTAIHLGAVDDLQQGSAALTAIGATSVPAHAIVGTGASGARFNQANLLLESHSQLWFKLALDNSNNPIRGSIVAKYGFVFGINSFTFGALEHDFFADVASQKGGINANATTTISAPCPSADCAKSSHFASIRYQPYSDRIVELLNASVTSTLFAEFPAVSTVPIADARAPLRAPLAAQSPSATISGGLSLVSPLDGSEVTSGDTVVVEVAPGNGFAPTDLFIIGPTGVIDVEPGSLVHNLAIPAEAFGPFSIFVVGFAADESLAQTDKVEFTVLAPTTMQAVEILEGDPILFEIGASRQLTAFGFFNDEVTRDISGTQVGTEYASSRPDVVSVSDSGIVTAVSPGIATVVARNGQVQTSVSVTVIGQ